MTGATDFYHVKRYVEPLIGRCYQAPNYSVYSDLGEMIPFDLDLYHPDSAENTVVYHSNDVYATW